MGKIGLDGIVANSFERDLEMNIKMDLTYVIYAFPVILLLPTVICAARALEPPFPFQVTDYCELDVIRTARLSFPNRWYPARTISNRRNCLAKE